MKSGLSNVGRGWRAGLPVEARLLIVTALGIAILIGWALVRADERPTHLRTVWPLVVLVLAILVPPVVRWPVVTTFGIYAFFVPFETVAVLADSGGATIPKLVGIVAGAVLLGAGLIERRLVRPPKAALWWGLLALLAGLSVGWAIDSEVSFKRLPTLLSLAGLYLAAVSIRVSAKELAWICVLTALGGALAAGTGYFLGFDENAEGMRAARGRLTLGGGEKQNPNTLGSVVALPLALAIGGFLGFRGWGLRGLLVRATALSAVGVMGVGLFVTMSRSAVLALATMLLVLLYRFRIRFSALVLVAVLLGAAAIMPEKFFERMSSEASDPATATGSGRVGIWATGVEALGDYWAIGAGYSNFPTAYARHVPLAGQQNALGSHNTYLGIWVELGIVGLALISLAVAGHLVAAARVRGTQSGALIALRAIEAAAYARLVSAFFTDSLSTKSFWMVWILLVWATRLAQESSTDPDSREHDAVVEEAPALVPNSRNQIT
jgi:O-antigen ligase